LYVLSSICGNHEIDVGWPQTQEQSLYPRILSLLKPYSSSNSASLLGWHAEGPFLASAKRGAHAPPFLKDAPEGFASVEALYGPGNLAYKEDWLMGGSEAGVRIITAAPEVQGIMESVAELNKRGVVFSIGHRYMLFSPSFSIIGPYEVPVWRHRPLLQRLSIVAHGSSHICSTQCRNCITEILRSSVFWVLVLAFLVLSNRLHPKFSNRDTCTGQLEQTRLPLRLPRVSFPMVGRRLLTKV